MAKKRTIQIKRVYETPAAQDGLRVLVDRLWPRGLSRTEGRIDVWLKELAPSHVLRRRFHANTMSWNEFAKAYEHELTQEPARSAAQALWDRAEDTITLLYGSKNQQHNNAAVLAALLKRCDEQR